MMEVKSIYEIRVGHTVVIKNASQFLDQGLSEVKGVVKSVNPESSSFSFHCDSTDDHESMSLSQGDVWLVD